jgi:hypothetical protein
MAAGADQLLLSSAPLPDRTTSASVCENMVTALSGSTTRTNTAGVGGAQVCPAGERNATAPR